MSRQTYTVTTRVRIEQTFEVDARCAQDAAEAAELYVARELTGVDILIEELVRPVGKQISPVVTVSTAERLGWDTEKWEATGDGTCDYLPDGPRGSL